MRSFFPSFSLTSCSFWSASSATVLINNFCVFLFDFDFSSRVRILLLFIYNQKNVFILFLLLLKSFASSVLTSPLKKPVTHVYLFFYIRVLIDYGSLTIKFLFLTHSLYLLFSEIFLLLLLSLCCFFFVFDKKTLSRSCQFFLFYRFELVFLCFSSILFLPNSFFFV